MENKEKIEKNKFFYDLLRSNPYKNKIDFMILGTDEDWTHNDRVVVTILSLIIFSEEEKGIELSFSPITFVVGHKKRSYFKMNLTPDGDAFISADSFDNQSVKVLNIV